MRVDEGRFEIGIPKKADYIEETLIHRQEIIIREYNHDSSVD